MQPRRLRIAVLNRVFSPTGGGAERYSIAMVEQLAARHDIHVFAQRIEHAWPGVTYHRVAAPLVKPRWLNQLWYAGLTWWATRKGFDVVHSHENTWHGNVQTMHVLPVRHNLFHGRHGWRRLLRWCKVLTSPRLLVYLMFERARLSGEEGRHAVVAASQTLRDVIAATYPASAGLLRVITPGVTLPPPAAPDAQASARRLLGLPAQGRCILLVGHDYRKKGLGTLLAALPSLPADAFVAVVGHPVQRDAFQSLAAQLGVAGRVHFLGALTNMAPAFAAADVLAHPTQEDTFAMVVIEAMAHGVAVVVSSARHCGISALLGGGVDALILDDPQNAAALATLLNRILGDRAVQQGLSEAGRAFAARHEWPAVAARQEAAYYAVCGSGT